MNPLVLRVVARHQAHRLRPRVRFRPRKHVEGVPPDITEPPNGDAEPEEDFTDITEVVKEARRGRGRNI